MAALHNTHEHSRSSDYMGSGKKKNFQWGLRFHADFILASHAAILIFINMFPFLILFFYVLLVINDSIFFPVSKYFFFGPWSDPWPVCDSI